MSEDNIVFERFRDVARQFCGVIDSARNMNRDDLGLKVYTLLPALISGAIALPSVESSHSKVKAIKAQKQAQWGELYSLLEDILGDWNPYYEVFDPTKDREAIFGSLADDLADIYRDLKEGLVVHDAGLAPPHDIIWEWRFGFYSHWGHHAIDALRALHFRLESTLSLPAGHQITFSPW
jgi:hypothetical protein